MLLGVGAAIDNRNGDGLGNSSERHSQRVSEAIEDTVLNEVGAGRWMRRHCKEGYRPFKIGE